MSATTRVTVDAAGVLKNKRFAFTSGVNVISELMQNARRAGATVVEFLADSDGLLVVRDNGGGIASFDKLLELSSSGWDDATQARENAFGEGFFSALYAAERVRVSSRGRVIDFDTSLALAGLPISIALDADGNGVGTTISLFGLSLSTAAIEEAVRRFSTGFGIEVRLNDAVMPRPHAQKEGFTSLEGVGWLRINANRLDSTYVQLYLQGLPVGELGARSIFFSRGSEPHVLHLDSACFLARLPDRACLIDAAQAHSRLMLAVRGEFRRLLALGVESAALMDELTQSEWITANLSAARAWGCSQIFNRLNVLPLSLLRRVDLPDGRGGMEYARALTDGGEDAARSWITRGEVEAGSLRLCKNLPVSWDADCPLFVEGGIDSTGGWPAAMLAHLNAWRYLSTTFLEMDHWAHAMAVDLSSLQVAVRFTPSAQGKLNGYPWADVFLCDSYSLRCASIDIVNDNVHTPLGVETSDVPALIIPSDGDSTIALRMAGDFTEDDNEYFSESLFDDACSLLNETILDLQGGVVDTVTSLINGTNWRDLTTLANSNALILTRSHKPHVLDGGDLLAALTAFAEDEGEETLSRLRAAAKTVASSVRSLEVA